MDRMSLVPGPMVEREDGREVRRDKPGTESRTVDRFTLEKRIGTWERETGGTLVVGSAVRALL